MQNNRGVAFLFCLAPLVLASALNAVAQSAATTDPAALAITPPMGWNSWDGYGTTINEAAFKANAGWFAKQLRAFRLAIRCCGHGMVRDQSGS